MGAQRTLGPWPQGRCHRRRQPPPRARLGAGPARPAVRVPPRRGPRGPAPAAKNPRTGKHSGSQIFYDLEVDGELLENAAWTYPADDLAGHIAFEWSERGGRGLDHWYEEEEEIFIHPKDPHHRVDALASSRHVQVEIDGRVVADTRRPVLLFETGLPVRYYIPREDVRLDLFGSTRHSTGCPYKGTAEYWSLRGDLDVPGNIVWSYPDPLPTVPAIKGLLAFYNEAVDITVDGERIERPVTPFTETLSTRPSTS